MEYQGKVGTDGGRTLSSIDNDTAPAAPDDHLSRFIEALGHHSAVCRKLHVDGAGRVTNGSRGKESG